MLVIVWDEGNDDNAAVVSRESCANGSADGGKYPHSRCSSLTNDFADLNTYRWLGGPRCASERKGVFQPFSIGPRSCIAKCK